MKEETMGRAVVIQSSVFVVSLFLRLVNQHQQRTGQLSNPTRCKHEVAGTPSPVRRGQESDQEGPKSGSFCKTLVLTAVHPLLV